MADYLDTYVAHADAARAEQLTGTTSPFTITVRFTGGLTRTQQEAFVTAADRWARVIVGDLPAVELDGEVIDDVLVLASGEDIDGEGNILGRAGPTHIRAGGAPCRAEMLFDSADLTAMERNGILVDVITHEMGHVLGIGTLWDRLVDGRGGPDPRYTGRVAMVEYGRLLGSDPMPVPVENEGGEDLRDSHWRERVFRNELMTSSIGRVSNPISRLTVASLIDLGYQVDLDAAEPYTFPVPIEGVAPVTRRLSGYFQRPESVLATSRGVGAGGGSIDGVGCSGYREGGSGSVGGGGKEF